MQFGYMPSFFERDLIHEIDFAKNHFDFIEITPDIENLKYYIQNSNAIKSSLRNFQVLGHIHWGINLAENNRNEIKKAIKSVAILKKYGAKKITIHPSFKSKNSLNFIRKNNLISLAEISDYCDKNDVELLVENIAHRPFNRAVDFQTLLKKFPKVGITLDIGHVKQFSDLEFNKFLKLKDKIRHIHLHHNIGKSDHLPFNDVSGMERIVRKIRKVNSGFTVTLEIFYLCRYGKRIDMNTDYRRKVLLKQLSSLKKISKSVE